MHRFAWVFIFALASSLTANAADWPRFRGPNGTGISDDQEIPVTLTDKNILWKIEVPGKGNSSPIVAKGHIFLQSSSLDQQERYLICIDGKSGQIVWSKPFPGGKAKTHLKNSPASNTPAADDTRIYAVFWDGDKQFLSAWDYAGKLLWQRDLGSFKSQHGSGMSPIVVGDKVIVNNDQDGKAELLAFDSKSGKPAWSAQRDPERACYATPFLLEKTDAGLDLIVASTGGITAYDPSNGTVLWNFVWKFDKARLRNVGSPIYHQGMIFAIAGDGAGDRHMIAIKAEGKGDVSAKNLVWEKKKDTPYVPTVLAKDGRIFWVTDKERLVTCVAAKSGAVHYQERLEGSGEIMASPIMIAGKIYIVNEKGTVYVIGASDTFEELGKYELKEQVYASPAVANGRLYIRGQKHLFCLGKTP